MRGDVYISIPAADKAKALPSSITRYDWNEYTYDDEGEVEKTTKVHPTWAEASWKDSEISALIALGSKKAAPKYTLMTASEARKFIADNSDSKL